jgi:nitrite reductase/ring-hydroxylating ferredoxin subunit
MINQTPVTLQSHVSADGIWKEVYFSREFAELERRLLWPKIWQVACREEDLPDVGSYYTYDILDDSIIVVRTAEHEIRAYNNACRHRGRRLTEGSGHSSQFVCKFHGWKWRLDGSNCDVTDREDYGHSLKDEDLRLPKFKVACWGGFVFVNMDPDCEPLQSYLAPVPKFLDPLEFEKQRYRWYISVEVEANWKTCQEAFMEAYHVAYTHPQLEPFVDSRALSFVRGKHGQLQFRDFADQMLGAHFSRPLKRPSREMVYEAIRQQAHDIQSIFCDRDVQAAARILTEVPEDASLADATIAALGYMREAAIAAGAGYANANAEQAMQAGFDWLIFPNTINVLSLNGGLWYRTRPLPTNDPDRCLFEMYALERFTPGSEPKVTRKHFKSWRDCSDLPPFLISDFVNIPEVHRGMKSRGFTTSRPNPVQERIISHFHEVLRDYLQG